MSPPTYAPSAGKHIARAPGCSDSPSSLASTTGGVAADITNGATPSGSGSMPSASAVIVALPASATSYTSRGSTSPSSHTSAASSASVSCAARVSRPSASGSIIVALIRVMTSPPNGCCLFSCDRTATGVPVVRSSSVATTVVVPRSKAIAYWRVGGVAGLDVDERLVDDHRRDLEVRLAQHFPQPPQDMQVGDRLEVVDRVEQPGRDRCAGRRASVRPARRSASAPPAAGSPGVRRRRSPPSDGWISGGTWIVRLLRGLREAGQPPAVAQLVRRERARVQPRHRHRAARRSAPCTSCRCRGRRTSSRSRCRSSSRRRTRSRRAARARCARPGAGCSSTRPVPSCGSGTCVDGGAIRPSRR